MKNKIRWAALFAFFSIFFWAGEVRAADSATQAIIQLDRSELEVLSKTTASGFAPNLPPVGRPVGGSLAAAEPTAYPHSTAALLLMKFPDGSVKRGSGNLVGTDPADDTKGILLTAGHNLYCAENGGYAKTVIVFPAYDAARGQAPFGFAVDQALFVTNRWKKAPEDAHDEDIGLVQLNRAFGKNTGTLALAQGIAIGETIHLNAYPESYGYQMTSEKEVLADDDTGRLYYRLLGSAGTSGGALYNENNEIVGIHAYEWLKYKNYGPKITEPNRMFIQSLTEGITGWKQAESGKWYYFDAPGKQASGWRLAGGRWYFMNEEALMQTGWRLISGKWYFLDASGAMATGWQMVGGRWYYFNADGAMQTGLVNDGGTYYYLDASGAMKSNAWQNVAGRWYLLGANGAAARGWRESAGTWYYFGSDSVMATGWQMVGGTWYLLDSGGAMRSGWQNLGGTWYLLEASGAMATGWRSLSGTWYYFGGDGAMRTGWQMIGGRWNNFSSSGNWLG